MRISKRILKNPLKHASRCRKDVYKRQRQDSDRNDAILCRIPAGRWGTSDDLMGAAVFLASDASSYVNGFTLAVDGGWLARYCLLYTSIGVITTS